MGAGTLGASLGIVAPRLRPASSLGFDRCGSLQWQIAWIACGGGDRDGRRFNLGGQAESRLQDPNLEKMKPLLVELMGEFRERRQERGEPRSHDPGAQKGIQRPWLHRVFGR
jgi:hypothetical protein